MTAFLVYRYFDDGLECPTVGRVVESAPDADIESPGFAVVVESKIQRVRLLQMRQNVVHLAEFGVILQAQGKAGSDVARDLGRRTEIRLAVVIGAGQCPA